MAEKILVVDDEATIVEFVRINLEKAGFTVLSAGDGDTALALATSERPDLIVLDVMLPGRDGFEVCRELRRTSSTPIIMLTARDEDIDKILGLELGADDYITKPFNPRELVARIKAILRRVDRSGKMDGRVIARGRLQLDLDRHQVTAGGRLVDLTPKEFELLELLMNNPGRVFSRETLLERLWGYDFFGDSKTVDVHIRRLREKVEEDPSSPTHILTVWGVGYKFREF
ncbi:MAG TPA: response regulator transcription factor [Firmicutes bacterium]|uniref:response regulator transcription factor n=1 Tax=Gelria sp. Kuro-4 TaxID=2796927 RepID=UPI0019863E3C|nr:response regulator transcription factor [Gelria sp. Kuro-4]MDI3522790.1 two-component system, OmpR family, response regulator [Bacillota bacterium]MDK2926689.1 two-component system, OmpR family, response regulator [Bacillota bacterium]BCV23938.1 DNA-binding response regulator [Gelria sp. Kuro-4]HHV58677.1 response regulator transcription factor [Bacillota bacterium]